MDGHFDIYLNHLSPLQGYFSRSFSDTSILGLFHLDVFLAPNLFIFTASTSLVSLSVVSGDFLSVIAEYFNIFGLAYNFCFVQLVVFCLKF